MVGLNINFSRINTGKSAFSRLSFFSGYLFSNTTLNENNYADNHNVAAYFYAYSTERAEESLRK